jgi:hypothetical protein
VNAERAIEMAEEALRANRTDFASELYESAARELAGSDQRRAAHFFLLASWHADPNREDRLAQEAQRIYEMEGDDEKIAEVAMLRAAVALRAGASDRARVMYTACARHATKRLAEILSPHFGENVPEDISSAMEVPVEQLKHCRIKLRELEGSE